MVWYHFTSSLSLNPTLDCGIVVEKSEVNIVPDYYIEWCLRKNMKIVAFC